MAASAYSYLTAQKMKFSIKDFFSICDQIPRKRRIICVSYLSPWKVFSDGYNQRHI